MANKTKQITVEKVQKTTADKQKRPFDRINALKEVEKYLTYPRYSDCNVE